MAVYKFDEVGMDGSTQSEAAEKLKYLLTLARRFNVKELKRFAEIAEKEPAKIFFLKKAAGL